MTAEELLELRIPDRSVELVRGRLVVSEPPGFEHGVIAMRIGARISAFVTGHQLGVVVASETGFTLARDPDTVRAPDIGFVRADRVPEPLPRGYAELVPDLIVEVLSPGDRPGKVLSKVADWLEAGARLVWVIDPMRRVARVYRADGSEALKGGGDVLEGEDVLEGFTLALADVL